MKINQVPPRYRNRLKVDNNGCWIWTGAKFRSGGYGAARICGKTVRVHRFIFELLIGPVPDGFSLHHKCEVPACCNPDHLIPLSQLKHSKEHLSAYCRRGHLQAGNNIRYYLGRRRQCKECRRQYQAKWREANREKIRIYDKKRYQEKIYGV